MSNNDLNGLSKRSVDIATWQMTKTFGDSVFKDGKQFHWCPHHKYNGRYDGLCITHPPEKHTAWKEHQDKKKQNRKDKWERKNGNKENNNKPSNPATPSSSLSSNFKLVLSDTFKQVMLTDQGFLELQLEQFMRSLSEN